MSGKLLDSQVGFIFRSALPEELEWDNRAEDVALSLDAIKKMSIKHADGPRQGHFPNKEWACFSQPSNAGAYHHPGTALALIHAPGAKIPLTHGRIS